MFSCSTHGGSQTEQDTAICVPAFHLLLHVGNSKGGWHDQLVHAASCHPADTREHAEIMHIHARAGPIRAQMAPRYKRHSGCVNNLPGVSGNFRSMIYMGITSTYQKSIKSTEGAQTADQSVPDDLFDSLWIATRRKPIPPLSFSFSFGFLAILRVIVHKPNTHIKNTLTHSCIHPNYLGCLPREDR